MRRVGVWFAVFALCGLLACDDESADDEEIVEDEAIEEVEEVDDEVEDADEEAAQPIEEPDTVYDELGVVFHSTSGDIARLEQAGNHRIEFCYVGGECERASESMSSSATVGGEGAETVLASSDPDRQVVGARIAFTIEGDGQGVVRAGPGELFVDDEGVVPDEDFQFIDDEMDELGSFSGGETVDLSFGHVY